jgi:hypothetical protein
MLCKWSLTLIAILVHKSTVTNKHHSNPSGQLRPKGAIWVKVTRAQDVVA